MCIHNQLSYCKKVQKPSNRTKFCNGIGFNNNSKMFSQYFIQVPMTLAYELSFDILSFWNSIYFEIPLLMNLPFHLPLIHQFPILNEMVQDSETLDKFFSHPTASSSHNRMAKPSSGLHKALIGDTLYCITGHLTSCTKK